MLGGEGAAKSREKDTWLWQSSQKSFQGHLVAPGGSFSLESEGKYDRGGGEPWGSNTNPLPRAQMLVALTSMAGCVYMCVCTHAHVCWIEAKDSSPTCYPSDLGPVTATPLPLLEGSCHLLTAGAVGGGCFQSLLQVPGSWI